MHHHRTTRLAIALAGGLLVGVLGAPAPVGAVNIGNEGCTPGYWKNHADNWEEATPGTTFESRFAPGTSGVLSGLTFAQTLALGGGPGAAGGEKILARAATASYLNAAHEGLGFPWRRHGAGLDGRSPLVATVNSALASGDRAAMLALAAMLDDDNNLGCPLN